MLRLGPVLLVGWALAGANAGGSKLRLGGGGGGKPNEAANMPACKGLGEVVNDPCESDLCGQAAECEKGNKCVWKAEAQRCQPPQYYFCADFIDELCELEESVKLFREARHSMADVALSFAELSESQGVRRGSGAGGPRKKISEDDEANRHKIFSTCEARRSPLAASVDHFAVKPSIRDRCTEEIAKVDQMRAKIKYFVDAFEGLQAAAQGGK